MVGEPAGKGLPGKYNDLSMKSIVFNSLGARDSSVLLPPGLGRDCNVVDLQQGKALVITSDPLYINPVFGLERGTWMGFQILAADMWAFGVDPQHAVFSLNLPNTLPVEQFRHIWNILHRECLKRNISIVSGHTGAYDGCNFPIIGAGVMFSTVNREKFMDAKSIEMNDRVILVGGPAREALASLLHVDEKTGESVHGNKYRDERNKAWDGLSIEHAARIAREVSVVDKDEREHRVKIMHDVAEGGVLGAMEELRAPIGMGLQLDLDSWVVDENENMFLANYFTKHQIWQASGQGALLIVADPLLAPHIVEELRDNGERAMIIGKFREGSEYHYKLDGKTIQHDPASRDPFWPVFLKARANQDGIANEYNGR